MTLSKRQREIAKQIICFRLRPRYMFVKHDACLLISYNQPGYLVVTESWHRLSTDVALRRSVPPTYSSVDQPRIGTIDTTGGGIVIIHCASLCLCRIPLSSSPVTFEALTASVSSLQGHLTFLAVYRPGSSPPSRAFFDELTMLLEQFALLVSLTPAPGSHT